MPDSPLLNPRRTAEMARFNMRLANLGETRRFRRLDRLWAYYIGAQHLVRGFDWDGRKVQGEGNEPDWISAAIGTNQFIGRDDVDPGFYIPLKARRPCASLRLPKQIVDRLTVMLFSESRGPTIRVDGDPTTEDYVQQLARTAKLRESMVMARMIGGATGTAAVSYKLFNGIPRVEVHDPKHLTVHAWTDRGLLIPSVVSELYRYEEQEERDGKLVNVKYWYRRDWNTTSEIIYNPAPVGKGDDPVFTEKERFDHNLGFCPLVWIQNSPNSGGADGVGDYDDESIPDQFDATDALFSAINKGTVLNVEPTLKLRMNREDYVGATIKKGSEHAIFTGKDGDASYMESSGSSISIGMTVLARNVANILDACSVVLVDPEKISGAAQSAKAIEYIYAPMVARADALRMTWGEGLRRVVEGLWKMCVAFHGKPTTITDPETGEQTPAQFGVLLPDRVIEDDAGNITREPREPGEGGDIKLVWGPYFPPTLSDTQTALGLAQAAAGGAQLFSAETMRRWAGNFVGVEDVDHEVELIEQERAALPGMPSPDLAGGGSEQPLTAEQLQAALDGANAPDEGSSRGGIQALGGRRTGAGVPIDRGDDANWLR